MKEIRSVIVIFFSYLPISLLVDNVELCKLISQLVYKWIDCPVSVLSF